MHDAARPQSAAERATARAAATLRADQLTAWARENLPVERCRAEQPGGC